MSIKRINLSLSAASKPKVSGEDVKNAKSILKAATRQQSKDSHASYKEVCKQLEAIRKRKGVEVDKLTKKRDALQTRLDRIATKFDLRISKLQKQRDAKALKAGLVTPVEVPKAVTLAKKEAKVSAPAAKRPSSKAKPEAEHVEHKKVLPSKTKVESAPDEDEEAPTATKKAAVKAK